MISLEFYWNFTGVGQTSVSLETHWTFTGADLEWGGVGNWNFIGFALFSFLLFLKGGLGFHSTLCGENHRNGRQQDEGNIDNSLGLKQPLQHSVAHMRACPGGSQVTQAFSGTRKGKPTLCPRDWCANTRSASPWASRGSLRSYPYLSNQSLSSTVGRKQMPALAIHLA